MPRTAAPAKKTAPKKPRKKTAPKAAAARRRALLINVAKHTGASTAEITSLRTADRLTLAVLDDGRGFDYGQALAASPGVAGLGLTGVRERAEFIGSEIHVDSSPGAGTAVVIVAPLRAATAEAQR